MKEIQNIPIRVWPCPALHVLVWNRRYVNSAEKWAWQSNTISATPTPYVLSLLYVLINMLINLLNKTFLWRHRDLHMLDEISLSLYYYYYYLLLFSQNIIPKIWVRIPEISEKKKCSVQAACVIFVLLNAPI